MDLEKDIAARYSCRSFSKTVITDEQIHLILSAGSMAPSSKNRQPWTFLYLNDPERISALSDKLQADIRSKECDGSLGTALRSMEIMSDASALIFVAYDCESTLSEQDPDRVIVDSLSLGACIENMLLQAKHMGLDSLWVCDICYCTDELKSYLGTEEDLVSCIYLGKSQSGKSVRTRAPLESKVRRL